ncbi:MAG: winged helix-turn-helix domain-containing protein [Arenibacterium sp.]
MHFAFADFELDAERAELRRDGQPVRIEPQVFDLLKLLVTSNNRLVTRDEIFDEIWGDRIVSDAALASRIRDARKALGDDGSTQKFIQTVQRRGLRFLGDVTTSVPATVATEEPAVVPAADQDPFQRPAVAVLNFEDVSGTGGNESLSLGLTDELIAALSSWRLFPVVSRQSSSRIDIGQLSAVEIGQELGARYLVHGTFRKQGNRIRLQISVTQTEQNAQIWSERLICDLGELLDVEEEIAAQIASLLTPELEGSEARRILRMPPGSMTAWELAMRALSLLEGGKRCDIEQAELLAQMAVERAPDWVLPHTLVARVKFQMAMTHFSELDSSRAFEPTLEAASKALDIDRNAWLAHALTAVGELWTNRNHEKAKLHIEKAIELNPSAGINYHFGGCIFGFSGHPTQARTYQERLFRVDPVYPYRAVIEADLGLWHMLESQFDDADERLTRAETWDPSYGRALQRRMALAGLLGDRDRANRAAKRLMELGLPLNVDTITASYPFKKAEHMEMFSDGLRRAGINM